MKSALFGLAMAGATLERKFKDFANETFIKFITRTSQANQEAKDFTLTLDKLNKIGKILVKINHLDSLNKRGNTISSIKVV